MLGPEFLPALLHGKLRQSFLRPYVLTSERQGTIQAIELARFLPGQPDEDQPALGIELVFKRRCAFHVVQPDEAQIGTGIALPHKADLASP